MQLNGWDLFKIDILNKTWKKCHWEKQNQTFLSNGKVPKWYPKPSSPSGRDDLDEGDSFQLGLTCGALP